MRGTRGAWELGLVLPVLIFGGTASSWAQDTSAVFHRITGVSPERAATGDTIIIKGVGFAMEPWRIQVTVDGVGVACQQMHILSSTEIHLTVVPYETRGVRKAPGEVERTIIVWVDNVASNPTTFTQISWAVVAQARVFVPVLIYLAFVIGTILLVGGGIFLSATGNLSLSKIQLGIWILVFSLSYVVLASIWRDFIPVTSGMLWLLGISSVTAVGAKAIAKKNDPKPASPSRASRTFSEFHPTLGGYRVELHRCQVLLWTLIVVVVYVMKLISTMHLPDIPSALLILMGVGGGTYLGFKYPKTVVQIPVPGETGRPEATRRTWTKRKRRPRRPSASEGAGKTER
jgi:hypothetical protein